MITVMIQPVRRFLREETGATAIEYAVVAAILAIGVVGTLDNIRGSLSTTFNTISSDLEANVTP